MAKTSAAKTGASPYRMKIDLRVLDHLMHVISAIRLHPTQGHISHVRSQPCDPMTNQFTGGQAIVEANEVANELAVGNPVQTVFEVSVPGTGNVVRVVGATPVRSVLADGRETISNPTEFPEGRGLLDLPRV